MATVQRPLSSDRARGRIGRRRVHLGARGQETVRGAVVTADPGSNAQRAQRDRMAACVRAWQSLTIGQRDAWAGYAAGHGGKDSLGQSYMRTAYNLFLEYSMRLLQCGAVIREEPPDLPYAGGWTDVLWTWLRERQQLWVQWQPVQLVDVAGWGILSETYRSDVGGWTAAGRPWSAARQPKAGEFRVFAVRPMTPLSHQLSHPVVDGYVWFEAVPVDEYGRAGVPWRQQMQLLPPE